MYSFVRTLVIVFGMTLSAVAHPLGSQDPAPPPTLSPAAQSPDLPAPVIVITSVVEDNQKLLRATVTLNGAPLEGAAVHFGVARTFGVLDLGVDPTLDDGTAGVLFPEGLPGNSTGIIDVIASIDSSKDHAAASTRTAVGGAGVVVAEEIPFPHALWSSKPLWPLVAIIVTLLIGVWSTYVFVVRQLVKIRREGSS